MGFPGTTGARGLIGPKETYPSPQALLIGPGFQPVARNNRRS